MTTAVAAIPATDLHSQQQLADSAFENYDFDDIVIEDVSGWVRVTPGRTWTRPVFYRLGVDEDETFNLTFTVVFDGEGNVAEAYAIDFAGGLIGHAPTTT